MYELFFGINQVNIVHKCNETTRWKFRKNFYDVPNKTIDFLLERA